MSDLEIKLDAYVLPDDHRVFKLFPGRTYRLNKEIVERKTAFLDIRGLDELSGDPAEWSADDLRRIITADRVLQSSGSKIKKRPVSQDTKRLRFLRNLLMVAKEGDLIVVPLGKGLDGEVAIGEFSTAPGVIKKVTVEDGENHYDTWGREITWKRTVTRRRFSNTLNKSLHAPTAFHLIEALSREEVYLAAYGSFTYDDIYVASFPSEKEKFTTTDQATIGIWFNSLAIIHEAGITNSPLNKGDGIFELGIDEADVELELIRNSPWTAVLRTVGPLAFSALAIYPLAVEGKPLSHLKNATVSAKPVAGAIDKCAVVIPTDMQEIAKGYGHGRWDASCRLGKKVSTGATLRSTAHLKSARKKVK
ncbi:hypothetical protein [Sphingomonas sp. PP-CC-1A-547]|uniref:hypothetical protein n=1 Tax=Sphingomonas sp. PP-CC-1A-547 TaxID=2135654 RepID=UPI0011C4A34C|nr:hypothetical protein [Sphingomonas sp. PP-CC-1A-547]